MPATSRTPTYPRIRGYDGSVSFAIYLHLQFDDDNWTRLFPSKPGHRIMKKKLAMSPSSKPQFVMARALVFATGCLACSCNDGAGTGSLTVLLEPEDVIIEGMDAGSGPSDIHDGWSVQFDNYLVAVGDIDLHFSTDESVEAEASDVFIVDLTEIPASGLALWEFDSLDAGSWEFYYSSAGAAHGALQHESVSDEDFELMVEDDFTYLVRGTLANDDGQSCPPASLVTPGDAEPSGSDEAGNDCFESTSIDFVFGATAETSFGPCAIDGVSGVAVPDGGGQTVAISIHGDHLFFNGFPEGSEGGISRYAQWLADCDLDLDGTVTQEELEAIPLSDLPQIDDRYQLGATPISLATVYDYVIAQFKTQGHYQGEGECPIDGVPHEHGEDEDHEDHEDHE